VRFCCWCGKVEDTEFCESESLDRAVKYHIAQLAKRYNWAIADNGVKGYDALNIGKETMVDKVTQQDKLMHVLEWLYTMDGEYDTKGEWRDDLVSHLYWLAGVEQPEMVEDDDA
jgi:hypothetical protein